VVDKGKSLIMAAYSSGITGVFYEQKRERFREWSLEKITGEIDWGDCHSMIKYEGFYQFGGRNQ
jgi:hypothetical protein